MSGRFRDYWRARSLREQRLLMVMAGLAMVVIVWPGVLRPLADARADARKRHGDTLVAVAQIEAEASRLNATVARPRAPSAGPPADIVRGEADALAITPSRIEPDAGGIRVDIPMIGAGALFTLVERLRGRGLSVDTLAARPDASGSLVVTMRLTGRGEAR